MPLRRLVCLSGVSGSGKSTLLDHVIHQGLLAQRAAFADNRGIGSIRARPASRDVVLVDQSPLSRTPRSNPRRVLGAWDLIRELYAATPEAARPGFTPRASRSTAATGAATRARAWAPSGSRCISSPTFRPCPVCEGRRFKPEVLAVAWDGQVGRGPARDGVAEALAFFAGHPRVSCRLGSSSVGLGYLALGQPLNTLSGGEAQRLKLVRSLAFSRRFAAEAARSSSSTSRRPGSIAMTCSGSRCLQRLLTGQRRLIEHHIDVLKSADWILELGPDAGGRGEALSPAGPPRAVAAAETATSPFFRAGPAVCRRDRREAAGPPGPTQSGPPVPGARENNLRT